MANTASLNLTNRLVSRCTEGGSAPALPPGARAIPSQRTQRITEETPATSAGCQSQIEHYVVAWL
jgi:hypothetical protein